MHLPVVVDEEQLDLAIGRIVDAPRQDLAAAQIGLGDLEPRGSPRVARARLRNVTAATLRCRHLPEPDVGLEAVPVRLKASSSTSNGAAEAPNPSSDADVSLTVTGVTKKHSPPSYWLT